MDIDFIVGSSSDITPQTLRLVEVIASRKDFPLNDSALNSPESLAIAIFNYPIVKNCKYKEFSEATKKIASAKYAYCKKSATFKEIFTKLIMSNFNKHHALLDLDNQEQIKRVKVAERLVKFIGELYNADFYSNENLAYFCEMLRKNSETSKISDNCLKTLIQIVVDRVKNESKHYKHNIHTAAILNIINECSTTGNQLKKNYRDLEIIEAVKNNKSIRLSSKVEIVNQTKKIFELIISGNLSLSSCIQKAYGIRIIAPDCFESEMLQLCVDYLKKLFEASETELTMISKGSTIITFIGKLFNMEAFSCDALRGFLSFLSKSDSMLCKTFYDQIRNVIYDRVSENNDEFEVLSTFFRDGFEHQQFFDAEYESDREIENEADCGKENQFDNSCRQQRGSSTVTISNASTPKHIPKKSDENVRKPLTMTENNHNDPNVKFMELLSKLQPANVNYILREMSQLRFSSGEEVIKKLVAAIVDHAVNKQSLIKSIVEIAVKLPETVVPRFSSSIMRKHLKRLIELRIFKCSERESIGYCRLVHELYKSSNYYDRFDIIILLESFVDNLNSDRTALPSLLRFTTEHEEVIVSKKLSKNMKKKLSNISQVLTLKHKTEVDNESKQSIEHALRILKNENTKDQSQCEDSNDDLSEISDYRYENASDEYVISVEGSSQHSAKITFAPPSKSKLFQIQKSLSEDSYSSLSQHSFGSASIDINTNVLPSMNIPPPVMLIAPPTWPSSGYPLTRSRSDSFPRLLETATPPNNSIFKSNDNTGKKVSKNSLNQSASSSPSVEYKDIESDDMYDTMSNDESSTQSNMKVENDQNDSTYSSLMDDRVGPVDEEERFKQLISTSFTGDIRDIEKFSEIFLRRGMKCKYSGYIKLIDVIEDALKNNMQLFEVFLKTFETKIFEFIKLIPKNQCVSQSKELNDLNLILIAAEAYNAGLMTDEIYFACIETLYNDIRDGKRHQITLFHQLIRLALDKVVANGLQHICKNYLDRLAEHVEVFSDFKEKHLLSWEIFVTMKILLYRTQKWQLSCPITSFKIFLKDLNNDNFISKANIFTNNIKSASKQQIIKMVEIFILATFASNQSSILVQVGNEVKNLTANDAEDLTFIKYLESRAHHDVKLCLENATDPKKMVELVHWIALIGDFYLGNVTSIYLVLRALEMLFEKEVLDKKIVDSINLLLRKVGFKIDNENTLILDKFFLFLKHIVNSENSYRSEIYKRLIDLRCKNWVVMEYEKDIEIIEDLMKKVNNYNFMQIALIICGLLCKSTEVFKAFNGILWKFILKYPELILIYAKFAQSISCTFQQFSASFAEFLKARNQTFNSISTSNQFTKNVQLKLSTVSRFVAYCYVLDVLTENDLIMWVKPNFLKVFSVEDKTELLLIAGPKVNDGHNNALKGFFGLIEYQMNDIILSTLKSLKSMLSDF